MSISCSSSSSSSWSVSCSTHLHTPRLLLLLFPPSPNSFTLNPISPCRHRPIILPLRAKPNKNTTTTTTTPIPSNENTKGKGKNSKTQKAQDPKQEIEEEEEVEVEMSRLEETALELKEYTQSIVQAIPGPRVFGGSLPWILAIPLTYVGITFVVAFVKTLREFYSPKGRHRRKVDKNALLCKSVDDLLQKAGEKELHSKLKGLMNKMGFSMEEILRKYIRYALNEKPFNPDLVASLIKLKKASFLEDAQVAEVLNEISRRIVAIYGPVVMDVSGYSEKGFKKKLAVQALFGKVLYLSELPEFSSKDSSLVIKEIFGVTDEDVDELRISTFSEAGDVDSLEKLVDE